MNIRIVSRPIAPPWDSGSMNMAHGITTNFSQKDKVYIPVVRDYQPTQKNVIDGRVILLSSMKVRINHLL